jgi:RNA polymerase sigma-70 factor (ECF subfamily)
MGRVQAGSEDAFEELVTRYQGPILGYLTGMLSDRDEALDATQETFVRLFTRADRHRAQGSFRAWLYKMATNVALDLLRKRRRRRWVRLFEPAGASAVSGDGSGVSAEAARAPLPWTGAPSSALGGLLADERAAAVQRAVATLPAVYRTALILKDLQDLPYEDVAGALGVSAGTVKSRVNRARNLLRDKLATTWGTASAAGPTARRT